MTKDQWEAIGKHCPEVIGVIEATEVWLRCVEDEDKAALRNAPEKHHQHLERSTEAAVTDLRKAIKALHAVS